MANEAPAQQMIFGLGLIINIHIMHLIICFSTQFDTKPKLTGMNNAVKTIRTPKMYGRILKLKRTNQR